MLVAAQMSILDLDAVLEQRTEWLDFSRGDVTQTEQEEETLRNIIRWSYNRLGHESNGEKIKALFRRLSVFKRGWTIEAARRVCAEPHETDTAIQRLMDSLWRASLIEVEEVAGRNRFSYLDIIREFAHKELEKEDQDKELAFRHARWATEFAGHWQPRLLTKEQGVALPKLFAEVGNFREAFQWACQCQNAEIALRLTSALWRLMEIKGFYSKGEEYLQKALELPGCEKFPLFRAKAFGGLGILAYRRGDLDASERCSRQRLALEREYGTDRTEEADALSDLGIVAMRCGEYQEALDLYAQSLLIHEAKKYDRGIAVCRFNIGTLFLSMDKLDKAEANVKVSLEKFEKAENERDAAFALNTLGLIERYRGRYDAASVYADRSLAIRKKLGDTGGMAETMVTQANILIGKRHLDDARPLLVESGKLFLQINNERGMAEALEHLASLATDQDFHAKAVILYAAAHELRKKLCIPLPPVAKRDRDARIESLRHALGDTEFATRWEKGRVMPPREAFALGVNKEPMWDQR
jgi:tetratricopeptide (TPR) repeat protein